MKNERRLAFEEVIGLIDWELCPLCKYGKREGYGCDGMTYQCTFPVWEVAEQDHYDVISTCWGFANRFPMRDIADLVGIVLSHNFDPEQTMFYSDEKERRITDVMGSKKVE